MEELRVEVLMVMKHAPDCVKQTAHDGNDGHFLLLAAGEQALIGGLDLRAALEGDQGGHKERQAQVPVAGATDVAWSVGGAALARPRIEPGMSHPLFGFELRGQHEQFAEQAQGADFADARHAAEPFDLGSELGLASGEFGGGLLQGFDPFLQVANVRAQIRRDESVAIRREGDGVEPRHFAGQLAAQLDEPATELLQGQDRVGGWSPRHELHALQELEDAQRIDRIGLGPGQPGTLEIFDRPWIDDHDFDSRRALQRERQAQAVNAGGFQTNTGAGSTPGEHFEQLAVVSRRVGQGAGSFSLAVAEDGHDQFSGADIEAGTDRGGGGD